MYLSVVLNLCFPETEKWQQKGSHGLGQDSGTALWGAGIVGPNDKIHTLLPVGTGQEGRTSSNEETHQTLVFLGGPEPRRVHGRYWVWWEVYGEVAVWPSCLVLCYFVLLTMMTECT